MSGTMVGQKERKWVVIGLFCILLLVGIAYFDFLQKKHIFLSWDDMENIVQNDHFKGLASANLSWMVSESHLGVYEPMSWLLKALQYEIFGLSSMAFHSITLVLHCLNGILFFLIALYILKALFPPGESKSGGGIIFAALFGALFYAVHPLRVEIVAWASGQPYALAGLFFLLSTAAYLRHKQQERAFSWWLYLSLVFYVLSVLSKSSSVMLPVFFLFLDFFPLKKFRLSRSLLEKVPFFLLAILLSARIYLATKGAQQDNLYELDLAQKIARASFALFFYLQKTLWPVDILPHYHVRAESLSLGSPRYLLALLGVLALSSFAWFQRRRHPWLCASWFGYCVLLAPVLGLVQHGTVLMAADRYAYLTTFGWSLLAGVLAWRICSSPGHSLLRWGGVGAGMVLLIFLNMYQVRVWRTTESLWRYVLQVDRDNAFACNNLGNYFMEENRFTDAEPILNRGVLLEPRNLKVALNYGVTLEKLNRKTEAIHFYQRSLSGLPNEPLIYHNLGCLCAQVGRWEEARQNLKRALELDPDLQISRNVLNRLPPPSQPQSPSKFQK